MLKIYSRETTSFVNNGLGILRDYVSSPTITEVLNGEYYLEFEYSKIGFLSEYILEENLIKAKGQIFRICHITKNLTTLKILAKHIVFDLAKNFLIDSAPTEKDGAGALNWILNHSQFEHNFTAFSDVITVNTARYVRKNIIEAFMTADNSLIKNWSGELEFDIYTIKLLTRRGQNRGLVIRHGKNLKGVEYQLDFSTVVTRIMPQGNNELLLPELFIDSPIIDSYYTPIIKKIDFNIGVDENTTQEQAYQKLRNAVQNLYDNGIDKPKISIKVDFIELSKVTEYSLYSNLEKAYLGDTIKFIIPELNLNFDTRIIKTVYDCVKERFTKFELGSITPNFVNESAKQIEQVKNSINPSNILNQARENATTLINNAMGGYIYKTQNELFIMDTNDVSTAQRVWRWNLNRTRL